LDHLAFEIDLDAYETEKKRLEGLGLPVENTVFEWTVFKVNYFVPSTTIIIPERYHENDVTEGARRATGVTSFFQRFLTSFAISFS